MPGYGDVLIVSRQQRDHDGDRTGAAVNTLYPGWLIAPALSQENADGTRDYTTDRLDAYGGPVDLDVTPGDRVYLAADDQSKAPPWEVQGNPQWWQGFGWDAGRVVTLQRIRG